MNNEECINETSLVCEKEILDALYKEAVMDIFNKAVKDSGITQIHITGLDMMNPDDILKVASVISINSENQVVNEKE